MSSRNSSSSAYIGSMIMVTIVIIIVFASLQAIGMTAGTLTDWIFGTLAFWWLMGVATFPWNTHFTAKEIVAEAAASVAKGITVNAEQVEFARKLEKRFLWIAVGLHILSAIVLALLAYFQITVLGYWASLAALLLTFVRPLYRFYDHLIAKLETVSREIKYPREDVMELRGRVESMEGQVRDLQQQLDYNNEYSWASNQQRELYQIRDRMDEVATNMEDMRIQNKREHEQLTRTTAEQVSKLSEDSNFLSHVREIIRFIKEA